GGAGEEAQRVDGEVGGVAGAAPAARARGAASEGGGAEEGGSEAIRADVIAPSWGGGERGIALQGPRPARRAGRGAGRRSSRRPAPALVVVGVGASEAVLVDDPQPGGDAVGDLLHGQLFLLAPERLFRSGHAAQHIWLTWSESSPRR